MKILYIYKNINPSEQIALNRFMRSPFFEISEEVYQLHKTVLSALSNNQSQYPNQKDIFQHYIIEYKKISTSVFNKIAWQLHRTIEQFHSHYALNKNQLQQKQILLDRYSEKAVPKIYHQLHQRVERELNRNTNRSEAYYLYAFQIKNDLYFHHSTKKKGRTAYELISETQKNLDRFYILSKLRIAIELLLREQLLKESHKVPLLEEIDALASKEKDPVFFIYRQIIRMSNKENSSPFFKKVKDTFVQHLSLFNFKEQGIILQFLLNYTNQLIKRGQNQYLAFQFELYQLAAEKKLLIENNRQMTDTSFTNVIITACLCREFDYAYYFLQMNKKHLHPDSRQNAVNLSWAYIYFHSKEFDKAWKQILKTEFATNDYKLRARALLLRCYYEQIHIDPEITGTLESSLKNFKKFLYRLSSTSNQVKIPYSNLILVVRALLNFNQKTDKKTLFKKKWLDYIKEQPVIAQKWLIEKIKSL